MKDAPRLFLFPLAGLFILFLGPILRDGMFIDGLAYTNLAKNMADGIGSIWHPLLEPNGPVFYGHPTLAFWVESLFFRILGNHLWTEDIYNTVILAGVLGTGYLLWVKVLGKATGRRTVWFPFLLFVLNQENQLRYPNTLLECSLTLVAMLSLLGFLHFRRNRWLATAICGVGAAVCFLIKGPVGLFPLGIPFFYAAVVERRFDFLAGLLPPVFCAAFFAVLFAVQPAAYAHVAEYWDVQVIAALEGKRTEHMASTRFKIVFALLSSNAIGLGICLAAFFAGYRKRTTIWARHEWVRSGLFFVVVGLSAILPIMISSKQASYYQVPSLPFLQLGLGLLLLPQLLTIMDWLGSRSWSRYLTPGLTVFAAAGFVYALTFLGTTDRRDQRKIAYAGEVAEVLNGQSFRLEVIGPYEHLRDSYVNGVPAFLNRYYDGFVDQGSGSGYTLWIWEEGERPGLLPGEVVWEVEDHALVRE